MTTSLLSRVRRLAVGARARTGARSAGSSPGRRSTLRGPRAAVTALAATALLVALGSTAQSAPSTGYHRPVVNADNAECLSVKYALEEHAALVGMEPCRTGIHQKWNVVDLGNGYYHLRAKHTNMCLDVAYRYETDGSRVVQAACWSNTAPIDSYNQQWRLTDVGNGLYRLSPRHALSKCLEKDWWGNTYIISCNTEPWQKWRL